MPGWLPLFVTFLAVSKSNSYFFDRFKQSQSVLAGDSNDNERDLISFGHWEALGPFRIGTREAIWGVDPLRAVDDEKDIYPSPLTKNATVKWESRDFGSSFDGNEGIVNFHLTYDTVDWKFLQSIYGWAALQYQAWARSEIRYHGKHPINVLVYPTSILELLWNGQRIFGGDLFGFERAPVVLKLVPGRNIVKVRLIREVRANGGGHPPDIYATLRFLLVRREGPAIFPESVVMPDVVNGRLVSSLASMTVCNTGSERFVVSSIASMDAPAVALTEEEISITPGQSRPVKFFVKNMRHLDLHTTVLVRYSKQGSQRISELEVPLQIQPRDLYSPQKFTFLHPGGTVSYAILRPPPKSAARSQKAKLPIMLNLHGAGVDADSDQVRHSFDEAADLPAWLLFPTGMSLWSGDDWHTWALQDIHAAVKASYDWIGVNRWEGPGILDNDLIVTGHSNGGQGVYHFAMHHADHVIAAAESSGYTSIQNYVPYVMWSEASPWQNAILETALSNFKHELFIENIRRTPFLLQHGANDDNVPAYHSRLMAALASQSQINVTYAELPGSGHWFEGAMTTQPLLEFYRTYCHPEATVEPAPSDFSFVVGNSDDFGTNYGILINQLHTPHQLAKVSVSTVIRTDSTILWHIKASNVRRLYFDLGVESQKLPDAVRFEGSQSVYELKEVSSSTTFVFSDSGHWSTEDSVALVLGQRTGRQRGAMDAILRTHGPFQIVHSRDAYNVAVQVSRNFLQYFGADAVILGHDQYQQAMEASGNIISIILGAEVPTSLSQGFPVEVKASGLWLRTPTGTRFMSFEEARSGTWLRPLPAERLELVVWGIDEEGLEQAARMVPTLTGVGQPDFVIFSKDAGWKGHSGTLAMGFFDYSWNITATSYLP